MRLPGETFWQKFAVFVATGFGLGMATPVAPGTVGTLPGVVFALWSARQPLAIQLASCALLILLAIPICGTAERVLKKKDDGRICADEWMLFPLCVVGLPIAQHLWLLPVCFLSARFFDIVKPPPARQLQSLHGGLGIVIDDFFASLYALASNHAIFWCASRVFAG